MKVQVIGTGIVGEATACLARKMGHEVFGYDVKPNRSPIYETVDHPIANVDIVFVCVPEKLVRDVVYKLVKWQGGYSCPVVVRSTISPVEIEKLYTDFEIHVCHNPEFLREATYLEDALNPPVVIIGQCCKEHGNTVKQYYAKVECPVIMTDLKTSTMAKLTLNNYLAMLVNFWCEINEIAKKLDINTQELAELITHDPRVSKYGYNPVGQGFGGRCLPKDLKQTIELVRSLKLNPNIFRELEKRNEHFRNKKSG